MNEKQLVGEAKLREVLWDETARPSLRWIREQQRRRVIPYFKVGRRVWFDPEKVRLALEEKNTVRARSIRGCAVAVSVRGPVMG